MTSVDIYILLGHKASQKARPSEEGFTHDWNVFVRGDEGSSIEHFVEKIVFHLHESFPKPRRVLKEPPFEVSESGYASFIFPIDIHFKNKGEPKKVTYNYDLYLRVGDSVGNTRKEKLTFMNPSEDFKKRLIKAGGVVHESKVNGNSNSTSEAIVSKNNRINIPNSINSLSNHSSSNHSVANITANNIGSTATTSSLSNIRNKSGSVIPSKDKSQQHHISAASSNNSPSHSQVKNTKDDINKSTKEYSKHSSKNTEFADLFGTPIQTRNTKESNNPAKNSLSDKSIKQKNKSSIEKNSINSSRVSTSSSTSSNLPKDYLDNGVKNTLENNYNSSKKEKRSKETRSKSEKNNSHTSTSSNSCNSSSNSINQNRLSRSDEKPVKIKKEKDHINIFDSSLNDKKQSPNLSLLNNNSSKSFGDNEKIKKSKDYHSKKLKKNLSSSSSSLNSFTKPKKRQKRSDSASSSASNKSTRSSLSNSSSNSSSSVAFSSSFNSIRSNSNISVNSSIGSLNVYSSQSQIKERSEQHSPSRKKKKKHTDNNFNSTAINNLSSANIKTEANFSPSRALSSSLSSINSDYKNSNKDYNKQKKKSKSKDKNHERSSSKNQSPKRKTINDFQIREENDKKSKKDYKDKKKYKDEIKKERLIEDSLEDNYKTKSKDKIHKKGKDSSFSSSSSASNIAQPSVKEEKTKKDKKYKSSSGQSKNKELSTQKVVKEKQSDSSNKQETQKERNVKKEATTSTTISFSNNNSTGTTTLEITSVKNVKMSHSDLKKSKQQQELALNQSDKRLYKLDKSNSNNNNFDRNSSSSFIKNKLNESYENDSIDSSPSPSNEKFSNKQEYKSKGQCKSFKLNNKINEEPFNRNQKSDNYDKIMSDMIKTREISPLSSDMNSELNFDSMHEEYSNDEISNNLKNHSSQKDSKHYTNGYKLKSSKNKIDDQKLQYKDKEMKIEKNKNFNHSIYSENESDNDNSDSYDENDLDVNIKLNQSLKKDCDESDDNKVSDQEDEDYNNNRKKDLRNEHYDSSLVDLEYINDLVLLQKQINELKDKDILHEIVSVIKESGMFKLTGTIFDFDLLKLDRTTIKKIRLCFE